MSKGLGKWAAAKLPSGMKWEGQQDNAAHASKEADRMTKLAAKPGANAFQHEIAANAHRSASVTNREAGNDDKAKEHMVKYSEHNTTATAMKAKGAVRIEPVVSKERMAVAKASDPKSGALDVPRDDQGRFAGK